MADKDPNQDWGHLSNHEIFERLEAMDTESEPLIWPEGESGPATPEPEPPPEPETPPPAALFQDGEGEGDDFDALAGALSQARPQREPRSDTSFIEMTAEQSQAALAGESEIDLLREMRDMLRVMLELLEDDG